MLPFAVRVCSIYRKACEGVLRLSYLLVGHSTCESCRQSRIYTEKAIFNLLLQCKFEGNMLKLPPL